MDSYILQLINGGGLSHVKILFYKYPPTHIQQNECFFVNESTDVEKRESEIEIMRKCV